MWTGSRRGVLMWLGVAGLLALAMASQAAAAECCSMTCCPGGPPPSYCQQWCASCDCGAQGCTTGNCIRNTYCDCDANPCSSEYENIGCDGERCDCTDYFCSYESTICGGATYPCQGTQAGCAHQGCTCGADCSGGSDICKHNPPCAGVSNCASGTGGCLGIGCTCASFCTTTGKPCDGTKACATANPEGCRGSGCSCGNFCAEASAPCGGETGCYCVAGACGKCDPYCPTGEPACVINGGGRDACQAFNCSVYEGHCWANEQCWKGCCHDHQCSHSGCNADCRALYCPAPGSCWNACVCASGS